MRVINLLKHFSSNYCLKITSGAILIAIAGYIFGIITIANNMDDRMPIVYVPPKGVYVTEFKKLSAHYTGWCYAIRRASIINGRLIPANGVLFNKKSDYRKYQELGYMQGQKLVEEISIKGTLGDILYFMKIQKILSENMSELDPESINKADFTD